MAVTAGFADLDVLVLLVADIPMVALHSIRIMRTSPLRQAHLGVIPLFGHQLRAIAGAADELGAFAIWINSIA